MRRQAIGFGVGVAALIALAGGAGAQAPCAGDCNENEIVAINELVTCVNIALGSSAVSTCTACDLNSDGMVAINELIGAVNAALSGCNGTGPTPTVTPAGAVCGNGSMEADETCDDGNTVGGDGCAANCTMETRRETVLDPTKSKATAQLTGFPFVLPLSGTQALIAGRPRDVATIGPNSQELFKAGEFPVVIRASDVRFDPVTIPGLACACVRGVAVTGFGAGISGVGVVQCGEQGLTDIDFRIAQDHDTTPDSPGNSGSAAGLPDDPECDDAFDAGGGITSEACLECVGATCSAPNNEHIAVSGEFARPAACNSPHVYTFSGGPAPRGSVFIRNGSAIGLLANTQGCTASIMGNGMCSAPDFGPDCLPCTDDDLMKGTANVAPTTSGTAQVVIFDSGDSPGVTLGEGGDCGGQPCVGSVTGEITDCDAIAADPNAPLTGTLVTAFPGLDSTSGDTATTTTLAAQH